MKTKSLVWSVLLVVVIVAAVCLADVFSNRAVESEYEYAADSGTWALNALVERQAAVGHTPAQLPLHDTQQSRLMVMKTALRQIISFYVDHTKTTNDFLDWFSTPIGTSTNGCDMFTDNFPMYTVTGLLARVGAPTNYLDYTPWRPLDVQSLGGVNSNTAPGFTTIDYGWMYMSAIMSNLKWTALLSCCYSNGQKSTVFAGGRRVGNPGLYSSYYGTFDIEGDDAGAGYTNERWPSTSNKTITGCLVTEAYWYNWYERLEASWEASGPGYSNSGFKAWTSDFYEDRVVAVTGVVDCCFNVKIPVAIRLFLLKLGEEKSVSTMAYASRSVPGTGVNCEMESDSYSTTSWWNSAEGAVRYEFISDTTISSVTNYCFSTVVSLNPPGLGSLSEYTKTASASVSVGPCVSGDTTESASESRTIRRSTKHYYATVKLAFLLKHQFQYP